MSHAFQINDDTRTTKRVAQRLVTRCGFFVAIFAAVFVFPFQIRGNGKSVLSLHLWSLQMTRRFIDETKFARHRTRRIHFMLDRCQRTALDEMHCRRLFFCNFTFAQVFTFLASKGR